MKAQKPILLFPIGKNNHDRDEYFGIAFDSLSELEKFQNNIRYTRAMVISNGQLYDFADVVQAKEDAGERGAQSYAKQISRRQL